MKETILPPKRRLAMLTHTLRALLRGPSTTSFPALVARNLPRTVGRLEIVRDGNGVAHIYATVESDLYAAMGALQGAERFVLLDLLRHLGAGRVCELVGDLSVPGRRGVLHGKRVADLDGFLRPLDFERQSERDFRNLTPAAQRCLEAFAGGVNSSLQASRGVYPPEHLLLGAVRPWSAPDCLLAARASAFVVSLTAFENQLTFDAARGELGDEGARRLYPEAPWADVPDSYRLGPARLLPEPPLLAPGAGSNNWAVAASRSASGAPLLANDPHVPFFPLPTYWHHVHIEGAKYHVQGGLLPGCPVFGFGHNGAFAWGVTTGFRDGWDVVRIRRLPEDRDRYRTVEGSGIIARHRETRRARFGRRVTFTWESCEHGILYPGWRHHDGTELAVRFVSADLAEWFEGHRAAVRARTVRTYRKALERINEGPFDFNHVYAHKDGHIGWELVGRLPHRRADGLFVRDADDPKAQWDGFVPFAEMPKMLNPRRGFVASANSIVDPTNFEKIATPVHFEPRFRQDRIEATLAASDTHDIASCARLQSDTTAAYVGAERDALLHLFGERRVMPEAAAAAIEMLATWDGGFAVESGAAAVFFLTRLNLAKGVFRPLLGPRLGARYAAGRHALPRLRELLLNDADPLRADIERAAGASLSALAAAALDAALAQVRAVCGDDPRTWRWGTLHRVRLGTPLSLIPWLGRRFLALEEPFPGDEYTVSPSRPVAVRGRLYAFVGATSRFICDMARPEEALFAHTSGPNGDIGSVFYANLSRSWLRFEYFRSALWPADEIPDVFERVVVEPPVKRRRTRTSGAGRSRPRQVG